jgi:hypothetical protein
MQGFVTAREKPPAQEQGGNRGKNSEKQEKRADVVQPKVRRPAGAALARGTKKSAVEQRRAAGAQIQD